MSITTTSDNTRLIDGIPDLHSREYKEGFKAGMDFEAKQRLLQPETFELTRSERAELLMLRCKDKSTLANNLCPDHRDKQHGKRCLACTIEQLERKTSVQEPVNQWQPIETAPKDGTKIDVVNRHGERTTDVWYSKRGNWLHWWQSDFGGMGEVALDIPPVGWMPLPDKWAEIPKWILHDGTEPEDDNTDPSYRGCHLEPNG